MFARSYATGAELFEKGFRSFDNGGTDTLTGTNGCGFFFR